MNRVMIRLLRLSKVPIWYTEGYNRHPYITFALPLSLGFSSEYEVMDFRLDNDDFDIKLAEKMIADVCPEGIEIIALREPVFKSGKIAFADFEITFFADSGATKESLDKFLALPEIIVSKKTKKGGLKEVDLAEKIKSFDITEAEELKLTLRLPAGGEDNINPKILIDKYLADLDCNNGFYTVVRTGLFLADGTKFEQVENMLKSLFVIFKGFFIGGTMMVPGVSGGSMAMILGIYNRLIESLANIKKEPVKNILFLIKFCIGSVLGIALFAKFIITPLMSAFPLQVSYFFLGAVAGGVPMIYKTAGVKKLNLNAIIYPVIGVIFVLLIAIIPEGVFTPSETLTIGNVLLQIAGGVIIAIGLILPGISVSQLLLMLGLYSSVISALDTFNIVPFIPLGIGVLIGTFVSAKLMDKAMKKYPEATYLIVFGFLLGSLTELFPGLPIGTNIPICLLTFVAGFCFIYFLQRLENKK